ncbi:MAG: hypothetical protein ABI389_07705 [Rhodanobacter sp.]
MSLVTNPYTKEFAMDMSFDFQPVYPHHDLLVEIGEVEMAMDHLNDDGNRGSLRPDLESRMESLLEALDHLAV